MLLPGAYSERNAALLLKLETVPLSLIEPTLTAEEMQAGEDIEVRNPLLPDAATTGTPIDRRLSMAALRPLVVLSESHVACEE